MTTADEILLYGFDRVSNTLTQLDTITVSGFNGTSVDWSPDGSFLAAGFSNVASTAGLVKIYSFDQTSNTLTEIDSVSLSEGVQEVNWSFDGKYIAVGTFAAGSSRLIVYAFNGTSLMQQDFCRVSFCKNCC